MSAIYRDPATGWLYRVSPQPENGIYAMQYRDPANSVVWKPDITWNTNVVYRDREHLQEGLRGPCGTRRLGAGIQFSEQ